MPARSQAHRLAPALAARAARTTPSQVQAAKQASGRSGVAELPATNGSSEVPQARAAKVPVGRSQRASPSAATAKAVSR